MALLDNFFSTKGRLLYGYLDTRKRERSCEVALEQVRLLLYKECDRRGRNVLFDSSTIDRVPADKNDKPDFRQTEKFPCTVEVAKGFKYVYKGPAEDAGALGEMMFGAVAMNCKSVSLKIHIMNDPTRLMCTKVFCVPSRRVSKVERKVSDPSSGEVGTRPLNVPHREEVALSFSLDRGDSGFYGEQSPYSSVGSTYDYFSMFDTWDGNHSDEYFFHTPPGRKLSTSSNGSWQRRTFQSTATRFELGDSANILKVPTVASTVTSCDSQVYSNSSTSGTSDSLGSAASVSLRRSKLGLALLITVADSANMDTIRRCVEHSPQLQALVCRLRLATLTAGAGVDFVSTLYRASQQAARWLKDLMYGPRLQPIWLNLVTSDTRNANKMADTLLADLCSVLSIGDTKNTNFFISTLLTSVLTHHLGWVTTVSPYDVVDFHAQPDTESRRPYNALWAQLADLCGSIGFPPRTARTIIAGSKNTQFMKKLLAVLTYFVRCGDVKRTNFQYQDCDVGEPKVLKVIPETSNPQRRGAVENELQLPNSLRVPSLFNQSSGSSVSTLVASDVSLKRSTTVTSLNHKLFTSSDLAVDSGSNDKPMTSQLRRNPTMLIPLRDSSDSSTNSSVTEEIVEKKVVFVLGDDEKLVGLKNKSNGGKSVKKSSKALVGPVSVEKSEPTQACDKTSHSSESPSKCCKILQHSKPIKHSGFKFEFDKYPQIVTNYMKSKNLEILDRHYIGKPGNLKLDNFQFDPTIVPPIREERCETCYKCQLMESMLQTPTNASEMEYMNDMPRQLEPQYAKESVVNDIETHCDILPKTFVRKRKENTIIVNVKRKLSETANFSEVKSQVRRIDRERVKDKVQVKQVLEFPLPRVCCKGASEVRSGFDASLLGGITDHYVPDLILQGTIADPAEWEAELRRDLDLTAYLSKTLDSPVQAVAIVADTNTWQVRSLSRECGCGRPCGGCGGCGGGLSPLVGAMLDALPAMRRAHVPAQQCLMFLESKLREFCVLSKTLADMLMSTDLCDMATLTASLNIDVNDVPLLLAVATTHTPQVATRYGISYR